MTATPWDRHEYFPHFPDGENWDPEWCKSTARKWQSWVASPGSLTIILACLSALGFGNSEIFAPLMQTGLIVLQGGMRPRRTGRWAMSSVNVCVFEPGGSLPPGSLSTTGAGMPLSMPHRGCLWDAQFTLLHGIPFLMLSSEIRRLEFGDTLIPNL